MTRKQLKYAGLLWLLMCAGACFGLAEFGLEHPIRAMIAAPFIVAALWYYMVMLAELDARLDDKEAAPERRPWWRRWFR